MDETPTAEDYASIDRAIDEMRGRGWTTRWSLNEAINGWKSLVELVETGYSMSIHEYTNDLSIRRWLEDVRPFLTTAVTKAVDAQMAPVDDQFLNATEPMTRSLSSAGDEWWCTRLPKVLSGELAEDVARLQLRGD